MQVYVVHESYGINGVYDSLLAVKQDFLTENDNWEELLEMTESDYTELLYQQGLYLGKEEITSFDYDCSYTPVRTIPVNKTGIVNML